MDLENLLADAEELRVSDPAGALELAETAIAQLCGKPPRLQARALWVWAGINRTLGRWNEAEAGYYVAARVLDRCRAAALDWVEWYGRLAFLRTDQRWFREAESYAARAVGICRRVGARRQLSRALVHLGTVLAYKGDHAAAEAAAREALSHLPPADRAYYRCAVHIILTRLCRSGGNLSELDLWLRTARELGDSPDSYAGVKLSWFEGLAHARHGRYDAAVAVLDQARSDLLRYHGGLAAVCAMDLALIHLNMGRRQAARDLAGRLFPVFQALRISREATAALTLYVSAARRDALSVELVSEIRDRLESVPMAPPVENDPI